jgi:long-chain acyl-CoA synthetase
MNTLAADPGFTKAISAAVNRVNLTLTPSERVRRFVVATEAFTIANDQMTPTLKIKRHVIRERYGAALDALYHSKEIAA